jgi:hypothetical protein
MIITELGDKFMLIKWETFKRLTILYRYISVIFNEKY